MFRLPELVLTPFYRLALQINIDYSEYRDEVASELRAAFVSKPVEISAVVGEEPATGIRSRVTSGTTGAIIELALDRNSPAIQDELRKLLVGLEDDPIGSKIRSARNDEALPPHHLNSLNDFEGALQAQLAMFNGLELAQVELDCCFGVGANDLPPGGIIRRGLGARARFREDVLTLTGARFAINSDPSNADPVEFAISWFVEPLGLYEIEGTVEFRGESDLYPNLLFDTVQHARDQFNRYILEHEVNPTP